MKTKVILLALPLLIVAGGVFAESKVWTSGNYKYELTDDGLKIPQINTQSAPAQKPSQGQGRQQASAPASSPSPISPAPASIDTETEPEPEIAQEPTQEPPATTETISDIQETTTPSDEPAAEPEAAGGVLETIVESVEDTAASVFNGFLNLFKVFKF